MDPLEAIDKLAQVARQEQAPVASVGPAVLKRLAERSTPTLRPLSIFAAAAAVAASIMLAIGVYVWSSAPDPMTELVEPLQVVSLW